MSEQEMDAKITFKDVQYQGLPSVAWNIVASSYISQKCLPKHMVDVAEKYLKTVLSQALNDLGGAK